MSASVVIWMVRDVFRRARSSGFLHATFAIIFLAVASCLSITVAPTGWRYLGVRVTDAGTSEELRKFLFQFSIVVGELLGILLVMIATASFLPDFLDPAASTVLFSKPTRRSTLLLGRYLGVGVFVAMSSGLLLVGLAGVIRMRAGVWVPSLVLAWPILVANFLAFSAAGAIIAVVTRHAIAVMIGSIGVAIVSWGVGFGKHFLTALEIQEARPEFGKLVNWVYYLLPKPVDGGLWLHDTMGIPPEGLAGLGLRPVLERGLYSPGLALVSTLVFAGVCLGMAMYELEQQDY